MTPTLEHDHSSRSQQIITRFQPVAPALPRGRAEAACAMLFARVTPRVSLDLNDRSALINAVVDVVTVDSGRLVPFSPRPSADLHLLVDGWALRSYMTPTGARLITDVVLPGDLFAWAPAEFYDVGTELRACGRARVAVLRKDALVDRGSHALARCWDWACDAETQSLRHRLVSLGRRDARLRIAHFMSELHDRLRRVGLAHSNAFDCPLTQEQLADVLGLTPVHVNRVLQALRRQGLLRFNRPRVTFPDLDRLHAEAGYADWRIEDHDGGQ